MRGPRTRRTFLAGLGGSVGLGWLSACSPAPEAAPAASATVQPTAEPRPPVQAGPVVAPAATPMPLPTAVPTSGHLARQVARDLLARMSLEQKVGQLFMLGFEGTALTSENRALIGGLSLGGVTLFARNVESPRQVAQLTAGLQSIADPLPLFISIDQEGGLVVRITRGATVFPGNMAVGATGDADLARRIGEASGRELLAMGINMNLAPVVDVNTNPLNPVIGVRSFGSDPAAVGALGIASVRGLQGADVSAVAKHFPGHGDTSVDSHVDLPVVPYGLDRLEAEQLRPFRAVIRDGVDGVMTAHLALPLIEPRPDLPATLSWAMLTGLLRERLGYQGLILTDALDMAAITRDRPAAEAAVLALEAGADLLLIAGITAEDRARLAEGPRALLQAVQSGRVTRARLEASVLRVLEAKVRRGVVVSAAGSARPTASLDIVGSAAHRQLALDAARRAITVVRDEAGLLPLGAAQATLFVAPSDPTRTLVQEEGEAVSLLSAFTGLGGTGDEVQGGRNSSPAEMARVVRRAEMSDTVVLATYDLLRDPAQQALARALVQSGKPVVALMLRGPYDATALPDIRTVVAAYGDRPVHLQAAAEALLGVTRPTGALPVRLA